MLRPYSHRDLISNSAYLQMTHKLSISRLNKSPKLCENEHNHPLHHPKEFAMRPEMLDDQHLMFRDSFRKFVLQEISPHHEQWEQDRVVSREVWRKAGEAGFLCMDVPEAYGGMGEMDYRHHNGRTRSLGCLRRWLFHSHGHDRSLHHPLWHR